MPHHAYTSWFVRRHMTYGTDYISANLLGFLDLSLSPYEHSLLTTSSTSGCLVFYFHPVLKWSSICHNNSTTFCNCSVSYFKNPWSYLILCSLAFQTAFFKPFETPCSIYIGLFFSHPARLSLATSGNSCAKCSVITFSDFTLALYVSPSRLISDLIQLFDSRLSFLSLPFEMHPLYQCNSFQVIFLLSLQWSYEYYHYCCCYEYYHH